jgi:site-specific recombinase XerD
MDDISLSDLRDSWLRHLTAANRTPGTRRVYIAALDKLIAQGGDIPIAKATKRHHEHFISDELARLAPSTVQIDFRALQQFWKWAVAEGEVEASPMTGMPRPRVPESAPPVISDDDMRKLLAACNGNTFEDRRDLAIVRLFMSTGLRLSELTLLRADLVSIPDRRAKILAETSKGRRDRDIRFGLRAANALERYLRIRRRHRLAALPDLWIGDLGPLKPNSVYQVIRRRARAAGVTLHPHLFRHTFAHKWMASGAQETDLQTLAGWKSAQMLRRYGASAANERALSAYDRAALDELL